MVTLDQRDFGIKPFSAMLGTLKIKPTVVVRLVCAAEALELKREDVRAQGA